MIRHQLLAVRAPLLKITAHINRIAVGKPIVVYEDSHTHPFFPGFHPALAHVNLRATICEESVVTVCLSKL